MKRILTFKNVGDKNIFFNNNETDLREGIFLTLLPGESSFIEDTGSHFFAKSDVANPITHNLEVVIKITK